jgi:hypothetical protein
MYVLVPLRSARVHGLLAVTCMWHFKTVPGIADVAGRQTQRLFGLG